MRLVFLTLTCALAAACGDNDNHHHPMADAGGGDDPDGGGEDPDGGPEADVYQFDSRFVDGESSVAYSGQALRQVLINDLSSYISALDTLPPEDFPADVEAALLLYYEFDAAVAGELAVRISTDPATLQATYGEIGSANLVGKIAGNDPTGQHKEWDQPGVFVGWSPGQAGSPDELVRFYISEIDRLADDFAAGNAPDDPNGQQIQSASIDADGRNYRQLLQKFLFGAVAFSQATDDYLDDADADHGINVDNEAPSGDGSAHSALEHHWDEGFGYFGAARDYLAYADEEIAGRGGRDDWQRYHDTSGDGAIDLAAEYNYSLAGYAAQRDLGSSPEAPTDFTGEIFGGLLAGRRLIAEAGGNLSDEQMTQLKAYRDQAVLGWEKVLAANVIHYINETLRDMATFGANEYSFSSHASHWSEAKGFALGLQFNPRKQISDAQFEELHDLLGVAPVLPGAPQVQIDNYRDGLLEARGILAEAYGFDPANVGDENGENGW